MNNIGRIKNDLRGYLSEYRFFHCLRVAYVARRLADVYHYDMDKAYVAGLIHDIAKEFSNEENMDVIMKYHLSKSLLDDDYSKLLHSDIGACLAKNVYGLDDDVCHAVMCHTIGDIPMNLLDKILFVADKIEPGKDYMGIEEERELAYKDINEATILCIENHHKKLVKTKKKIYPKSLDVLNYLKKERSE